MVHVSSSDIRSSIIVMTLQYMVYDWNDLVADIGGYLGLLLGQSVYGIFELLTLWMKKRKSFKWPLAAKSKLSL